MTLIFGFILGHLGTVLAALGGIAALVVSFVSGHKVATAKAAVQVSAAQTTASNAQADADAAKAQVAAIQNVQTVKDNVAQIPDTDLDKEGAARGLLKD